MTERSYLDSVHRISVALDSRYEERSYVAFPTYLSLREKLGHIVVVIHCRGFFDGAY